MMRGVLTALFIFGFAVSGHSHESANLLQIREPNGAQLKTLFDAWIANPPDAPETRIDAGLLVELKKRVGDDAKLASRQLYDEWGLVGVGQPGPGKMMKPIFKRGVINNMDTEARAALFFRSMPKNLDDPNLRIWEGYGHEEFKIETALEDFQASGRVPNVVTSFGARDPIVDADQLVSCHACVDGLLESAGKGNKLALAQVGRRLQPYQYEKQYFLGKDMTQKLVETYASGPHPIIAYLDAIELPSKKASFYVLDVTDNPEEDKEAFMRGIYLNPYWRQYYKAAMRKSTLMIFLISFAWLRSPNCHEELQWLKAFFQEGYVNFVAVDELASRILNEKLIEEFEDAKHFLGDDRYRIIDVSGAETVDGAVARLREEGGL